MGAAAHLGYPRKSDIDRAIAIARANDIVVGGFEIDRNGKIVILQASLPNLQAINPWDEDLRP